MSWIAIGPQTINASPSLEAARYRACASRRARAPRYGVALGSTPLSIGKVVAKAGSWNVGKPRNVKKRLNANVEGLSAAMLTVTVSGMQPGLQSGLQVGSPLVPSTRSFVEYCTLICIPPVVNCGRSGNAGTAVFAESVSHDTTFCPEAS